MAVPKEWVCYILQSESSPTSTYVGATVDMKRRIRQHNGEIKGGARRTRMRRPWNIFAIVSGFPDKISALQFEWRMHHPPNRKNSRGIKGRINSMNAIISLDKWTSKAVNSSEIISYND